VQAGLVLSKSEVIYFKHNDAADLERILQEIAARDAKTKKKLNRRFIVVEGLYLNYGDQCPLKKIVELKNQYKFRLIMDDSMGFGVLGKTGRGTPEHFNIPVCICVCMSVTRGVMF
jgi:serine palmitoyltransferase